MSGDTAADEDGVGDFDEAVVNAVGMDVLDIVGSEIG